MSVHQYTLRESVRFLSYHFGFETFCQTHEGFLSLLLCLFGYLVVLNKDYTSVSASCVIASLHSPEPSGHGSLVHAPHPPPTPVTNCLLLFERQVKTDRYLTFSRNLWHNQLWQWLEKGCRKLVLGVCERYRSTSESSSRNTYIIPNKTRAANLWV